MKKFSLILASRERVSLLQSLLASIETTVINPESIEVFVGIDNDDKDMQSVKNELEMFHKNISLKFYSRERSTWMHRDYINAMFRQSSGRYVLVLNDDTLLAKHGWDTAAYQKLENYLSDKPDRIVCASTKDDTGDLRCCCFPLFSREACLAAGWVLPDERPNWGADWDVKKIYSHPSVDRMINLPELEVRHLTHHNNTRKRDGVSINIERVFQRSKSLAPNWNLYINKLRSKIDETSKMRMLVVYNICELAGRENWKYYLPAVHNILRQQFEGMKIAVSGCRVSQATKERFKTAFQEEITYNWINDILPLNTTFNHTVHKCFEIHGPFQCVTYIDSGVNVGSENLFILQEMWDRYASENYAIVTYPVDTDMGLDQWKIKPIKNSDMEIPLGKAVNLHLQLFGKEIYDGYDHKILPDIFASDTSESIFTFMCAALGKKWLLIGNNPVRHRQGVDGPSVGFRNKKPLLFNSKKTISQICAEGAPLGFGYEECRPVLKHDPGLYENEKHIKPELLREFIKNNCFMENGNQFYSSINHIIDRNTAVLTPVKENPTITCVLTSHNKPQWLSDAINSVINQTFQNWSLIIIDSGELFRLGYFEKYTDPRITVKMTDQNEEISGKKSMMANSFNRVLNEGVHSTLITYLHDDDIYYSHAFESMIDFLKENPHTMAFYSSQDIVSVDDSGTVTYLGETIADQKRGICIGAFPMSGYVNYLQFAHRPEVIKYMHQTEFWPEDKTQERTSAGYFMDQVGAIFPIFPMDLKIGTARRTPVSLHTKAGD